jgi:hypothetical protein
MFLVFRKSDVRGDNGCVAGRAIGGNQGYDPHVDLVASSPVFMPIAK